MTAAAPAGPVPPAPPVRERLGAIDVGSNSIRLVVAEFDAATGLTVIDEVKEAPRLARGVAARGRLDPAAVQEALAGLRRMAEVCRRRGVTRIAAVATSAVRDAEDGPEFVRLAREEVGIPLEIIDAEREAALSYRSVAHHFPLAGTRTLVADIGGGSLELIGAVDGLVEQTVSLPMGAVRLTELWVPGTRDPRREVADLRAWLRKQFRKALKGREWTHPAVIGSGGSFTTLGRIVLARRGLSPGDPVHGLTVNTAEVEHLLEWLSTKSAEQRREVAGLNPQRADIILAGLAVTAELLGQVDARTLTISAFGLREGLLLEMAGPAAVQPGDPMRLVREFMERCQCDRRHVEHVRVLALQLFDELGPALGADESERALLEAAALLHDVGQLVSYTKHHQHSYQLVMYADRLTFPPRDRALVALIGRYHRKKGPSRKHEPFAALPAKDQAVVRRLSGILRVADGLDRGHAAVVDRVRVELARDRAVIRAVPRVAGTDLSLEVWGAQRKADVLERALEREVEIAAG